MDDVVIRDKELLPNQRTRMSGDGGLYAMVTRKHITLLTARLDKTRLVSRRQSGDMTGYKSRGVPIVCEAMLADEGCSFYARFSPMKSTPTPGGMATQYPQRLACWTVAFVETINS